MPTNDFVINKGDEILVRVTTKLLEDLPEFKELIGPLMSEVMTRVKVKVVERNGDSLTISRGGMIKTINERKLRQATRIYRSHLPK